MFTHLPHTQLAASEAAAIVKGSESVICEIINKYSELSETDKVEMTADIDFFEACSSNYGYDELARFQKGSFMQALYADLKTLLKGFYSDPKDASYGFENPVDKKHCWIAGAVDYRPYQLSWDESLIALQAVYADYPLLFFSDLYKTGGNPQKGIISPVIDSECARGDFRLFYVRKVEEEIAKLASKSALRDRERALRMYRTVRGNCRYDRNKGQIAAYVDIPSHSILGFVKSRAAVCQGYARTYQALMNYASIPTVSVGVLTRNGPKHSCNFAYLADEGQWIMVDCTVGAPGGNDGGFDISPGLYQQLRRNRLDLEYYAHRMEFNEIWDEFLSE